MKFRNIFCLVFIITFIGCSAPKVMVSYQEVAETAANKGNYTEAVEAWKQFFSQQPVAETEAGLYAKAAKTAFLAGSTELAISWFDQARYKNYKDAEMYATLAEIFRSQKNLSKELSALEFYAANFNENVNTVYSRLFDLYFEIDMHEKAFETWEKLSDNDKNELKNQKAFFIMNMKSENAPVCDSLSLLILEKEPENVEALEWNAKKYYWIAENRYQEQMALYEKNKTNRQYLVLLEELKTVTADFKKALPYFDKLWKLNPGKGYASFLANIYARFGDESKAKSYQEYLK